ncbi:hydrogenase formation protein HypD [Candidatus Woesearchaeota archaeon]|nr:hydrogenase formation protein HypD [Candidatus Woesearchaeota archaeon]
MNEDMINENKLIEYYLQKIKSLNIGNRTIMEICGGHTNIILKYGIRDILPKNLKLISGPGCPVCVSAQSDIDNIIGIARSGVPVATYGDVMRVPGTDSSLESVKAEKGNVFEVYSASEVLAIREKHPNIVFFGVGFETTAPMTAYLLQKGVCVYSCHKLVPPAMEALLEGEVHIDGFLNPGHVSTIIGVRPYRRFKVAQAIAGFSAERVMRSIFALCKMLSEGKQTVVNAYPEGVREEGNPKAQRVLKDVFYAADSEWRGLGIIPDSGLNIRNKELDAKKMYSKVIMTVKTVQNSACRCGEVLKGIINPDECSLFGRACTPENPIGPCMVSKEGSCAISYAYK